MNTCEGTEKTPLGHYELFLVFVKLILPPPQEKTHKTQGGGSVGPTVITLTIAYAARDTLHARLVELATCLDTYHRVH